MPKNCRSPTAHVIDVFTSIDVPDPCIFPTSNEQRITANIAKGAHRRIYAAGDAPFRGSKQCGGTVSHFASERPTLNAQRPTLNFHSSPSITRSLDHSIAASTWCLAALT